MEPEPHFAKYDENTTFALSEDVCALCLESVPSCASLSLPLAAGQINQVQLTLIQKKDLV
jgi:hypothetical protein